jgi:hypothetical protein
MSTYIFPADPTSRPVNLNSLRVRAKRRGFWIEHSRHSDLWTLVEARTGRSLLGLESVHLITIAREVMALPPSLPKKPKRRPQRAKSPSKSPLMRLSDLLQSKGREESAATHEPPSSRN